MDTGYAVSRLIECDFEPSNPDHTPTPPTPPHVRTVFPSSEHLAWTPLVASRLESYSWNRVYGATQLPAGDALNNTLNDKLSGASSETSSGTSSGTTNPTPSDTSDTDSFIEDWEDLGEKQSRLGYCSPGEGGRKGRDGREEMTVNWIPFLALFSRLYESHLLMGSVLRQNVLPQLADMALQSLGNLYRLPHLLLPGETPHRLAPACPSGRHVERPGIRRLRLLAHGLDALCLHLAARRGIHLSVDPVHRFMPGLTYRSVRSIPPGDGQAPVERGWRC